VAAAVGIDRRLAGFHLSPVPGLVSTRTFHGSLAQRTFLSTQYIRHHSVPYYTPEPDIVHEIIGHANMLASPVFADLYEVAGRASLRATTDVTLGVFSRVFWFTLEFGVVHEDGAVQAYGAGLLSSYGEIETFRDADIRDWELGATIIERAVPQATRTGQWHGLSAALERLPRLASTAVRAAKKKRAVVNIACHDAGTRPAQLVVTVASELARVVVARRAPRSARP